MFFGLNYALFSLVFKTVFMLRLSKCLLGCEAQLNLANCICEAQLNFGTQYIILALFELKAFIFYVSSPSLCFVRDSYRNVMHYQFSICRIHAIEVSVTKLFFLYRIKYVYVLLIIFKPYFALRECAYR